ncbi:MAG: type II toxin-antitoxin system HicB family antitoxin [Candidatus Kapabacteria bacterium]|jgi:predicted RNase H-like HicB family nuclease|nr:type II toxin-antitoxin system HicB family antitoxin [Candidatus Kapabacteria bacterium]
MKYAVIIEKGTNSYGAYVPDLPGCVAVGETENETIELIKDAIEFHLESFKLNKKRLPKAKSKSMEFEFN